MTEKSEHIIRREHFVAGVETGVDSERERIIQIIENAIIDSEGYCHADTVIALIKKEN